MKLCNLKTFKNKLDACVSTTCARVFNKGTHQENNIVSYISQWRNAFSLLLLLWRFNKSAPGACSYVIYMYVCMVIYLSTTSLQSTQKTEDEKNRPKSSKHYKSPLVYRKQSSSSETHLRFTWLGSVTHAAPTQYEPTCGPWGTLWGAFKTHPLHPP